jgi:hypothetical protein
MFFDEIWAFLTDLVYMAKIIANIGKYVKATKKGDLPVLKALKAIVDRI